MKPVRIFFPVSGLLIVASLAFGLAAGASLAGDRVPGSEAIVEALLPSRPAAAKAPKRAARTRGIKIIGAEPEEADLPAINLTVNFEFDSARLTADGMSVLRSLGKALQDSRLKGMQFRIAGHTDAKGSENYNRKLSDRRARVVADHLKNFYGIAESRLVPVGYGEERLLVPDKPESGRNRRVEVVNLSPLS